MSPIDQNAYRFMEKEVAAGHQVYIICPMVEESDELELENVTDYTEKLQKILPMIRIACLHGKMKPKEKNEIMERFAAGDIQILISTTVIEVGINVPNATVMMVENQSGLAWRSFISSEGVWEEVLRSHTVFL